MSFFSELGRRNVLRVGIAYLAGAWLLIQIVETLFPVFELPDSAIRVVVIITAIGFVPALILAWIFELTPSGVAKDAGVSVADPKRYDRIIMALLVLAVAYFSVDKFLLQPPGIPASDKSIVVLPFVNMSDDSANEYFADGISEQILNALAKLKELRVISRSSAFAFKGQTVNIADVAEQLNVSYVLEGSVRKSGNAVRITAQLIQGQTDTHIWSETYDRTLDDIFAIQDEIAQRVAQELQLRILDEKLVSINPLAYEAWLQARYLLNLYDQSTMDEIETLIDTGLALEPDYPELLLAKTRYHSHQRNYGLVSREEVSEKHEAIKAHLQRVAPDHPSILMWGVASEENPVRRAEMLARAYRAAPTDPTTIENVARFARGLGQFDVAISLGEYLVARDPLCGRCYFRLGLTYGEAGHHEAAVVALKKALLYDAGQLDPALPLGYSYLMIGDLEAALRAFEISNQSMPRQLGFLLTYYEQGRHAEFDALFAEIAKEAEWEILSTIYAWTGSADKAFELLEAGLSKYPEDFGGLFANALYIRIQDDPRWHALMEKAGTSAEQLAAIELDISVLD